MDAGSSSTPIAIIGMGCRFSGDVTNPDKLWELVAAGRSGWTEIPSSRFNVDGLYHPNSEKPGTVSKAYPSLIMVFKNRY
jgi:acyl transferase domain-containing protein